MARRASTLALLAMVASCSMVQSQSCDQIPANRVWDVQWSGNPLDATESASWFSAPFNPSAGRVPVDADDYFTLTRKSHSKYQLMQFSGNGTMKTTFPEGVLKANAEVVFYIIHGFYGTVITKDAHHKGDSAEFVDLVTTPSPSVVEEALGSSCLAKANEVTISGSAGASQPFLSGSEPSSPRSKHTSQVTGEASYQALPPAGSQSMVGQSCDQIPVNRVFDVQWSGSAKKTTEFPFGFSTPYNPSIGRLHVDPTDYFTLTRKSHDEYQLKQFSGNGTVKSTLPDGVIKANAEVVFYIIRGFYGTVITKDAHHKGDSAKFLDLVAEPSRSVVEQALGSSCLAKADGFLGELVV